MDSSSRLTITSPIARRLRRMILLEVILIFCLYILVFTVTNTYINYETSIMKTISQRYESIVRVQEVKDSLEHQVHLVDQYLEKGDSDQLGDLKQSLAKNNAKVESYLSRVDIVATETPITDSNSRLRNDWQTYLASLQATVMTNLGIEAIRPGALKVGQVETISQAQSQLNAEIERSVIIDKGAIDSSHILLQESLERRTALLGLQAMLVIVSVLSIAYGYILPRFGKLLGKIVDQNQRLRQSDHVKMEFLSISTHQLKTPLSGLKWNLSLLKREHSAKFGRASILVKQSILYTDAMIRLVTNFLNVARIEEGKLEPHPEKINLTPIIKGVIAGYRSQAKAREVKLILQLPEGPQPCTTDPLLVKEIAQNLIDNAILYNKKGGQVEVTLARHVRFYQMTVADTGIGMTKEEQNLVFTEFYRGEQARTMRPDGSGLGLYFVKKIVTKLGGRISVLSPLSGGAVFTVTLPV